MKILRSIGAVVAGFVACFLLAVITDAILMALKVFPAPDHPELYTDMQYFIIFAYTAVYSAAGAWLTARLAPSRPMVHALVLGVLGMLASTLGAVSMWSKAAGHEWYPIALIAMAIPACWLGGKLQQGFGNRGASPK